MAEVKFLLSGDTSVTVEFGNEISPAINSQIRALTLPWRRAGPWHYRDGSHLPLPHGPLRSWHQFSMMTW